MHYEAHENYDYDFMINNNESATSKSPKYKIKTTKSSEKSTIVTARNDFKCTNEKKIHSTCGPNINLVVTK